MRRRTWIWILFAISLAALLALLLRLEGGAAGAQVADGSTLVVPIEGDYPETTEASLLSRLLGEQTRPFASLLGTLGLARRDARIGQVVLRLRGASLGWAKADEVRASLGRLRAAGKKVTAILEVASLSGNREYFVASAADEVYLVPGGILPLVGMAAEYTFLGGAFAKVGIEFEVAKAGKYKSAVESIAGEAMSAPSREMASSILDAYQADFVAAVSEGRGLSPEQVRAAIDQGPILSSELEALGLIDGVASYESLEPGLGPIVTSESYASVTPESVGFDARARVALLYGTGTVVTGRGRTSPMGAPAFASQSISKALLDAAEDDSIDALILRIDSPGGSSLASEMIWEAMRRARAKGKPIIASFSDVAASGGYYVATAADAIVASPGTLTGSIGVFALRPIVGGLYEKLGVGVETFTRGTHADFLLMSQRPSAGSRERLERAVGETYALFVDRVASGREMEPGAVDAVAQGRVWTGSQAAERGLVDELGGLHAAVGRVKSALGLEPEDDVRLVPYPTPPSLLAELRSLFRGELSLATLSSFASLPLFEPLAALEARIRELPIDEVLAISPWVLEVH